MKLISKTERVETVPSRWKNQYFQKGQWTYGDNKERIYNKLIKLDPLTEEAIVQIIGNSSWTQNICDECGKDCDILIEVGEETDYESSTARICHECLSAALFLVCYQRQKEQGRL